MLATQSAIRESPSPADGPTLTRYRILVVDDSPVDRHLVGGILAWDGALDVSFAANGSAALESIARQPPDIVLTDLQMPELDGLDLVRAVRVQFPLIPTILMTAHGNEETAITALRSGAASYVSKHNLARALIETIRDVLTASVEGREQRRLFECWSRTDFAFALDNDAGRIPALVNHLRQYIATADVCDHTEYVRVGVALHEAIRNAIHHGNLELTSELRHADSEAYYAEAERRRNQPRFAGRRVWVVARETPTQGQYIVRDEGPGFDPQCIEDPTAPEHLSKPSGRGLFLIRMFMDEVTFNPRGNEITMTHRRRRATGGPPGASPREGEAAYLSAAKHDR